MYCFTMVGDTKSKQSYEAIDYISLWWSQRLFSFFLGELFGVLSGIYCHISYIYGYIPGGDVCYGIWAAWVTPRFWFMCWSQLYFFNFYSLKTKMIIYHASLGELLNAANIFPTFLKFQMQLSLFQHLVRVSSCVYVCVYCCASVPHGCLLNWSL